MNRAQRKKILKKVNDDAYTFVPTVEVYVAADAKRGRIIVKALKKPTLDLAAAVMLRHIDLAVKRYVAGSPPVRECSHPRSRRRTKKEVIDTTSRGVEIVKYAAYCTKCGLRVTDYFDRRTEARAEVVLPGAVTPAAPVVRRRTA